MCHLDRSAAATGDGPTPRSDSGDGWAPRSRRMTGSPWSHAAAAIFTAMERLPKAFHLLPARPALFRPCSGGGTIRVLETSRGLFVWPPSSPSLRQPSRPRVSFRPYSADVVLWFAGHLGALGCLSKAASASVGPSLSRPLKGLGTKQAPSVAFGSLLLSFAPASHPF